MTDFQPTARVIADSISPTGNRLSTLEVTMHRFMLPELNTHRAFSRNSASSRAIPASKTIHSARTDPAIPLSWPTNKAGMQAGEPLPPDTADAARARWLQARDAAVDTAEDLADMGVHKSVINRLLEPFLRHVVVITATDYDGFFAQRATPTTGEPLAQAEMVALADAMRAALHRSAPIRVSIGHWHLPYVLSYERRTVPAVTLRKVSAARCARVSYLNHHGRRNLDDDVALYDRLVTATPPHASPLEHIATPASTNEDIRGNFTGWHQLRHLLPENP